MEAAATPAEYDKDTGQETKAKSYPDAATVYEEIDTDEVDLRTHKWLKSRYDTEEWAALREKRDALLADCDWVVVKGAGGWWRCPISVGDVPDCFEKPTRKHF